MLVQIDPLILVLDLEQLKLRSKEELLVLLRDHILLIIMGQLRDIKERERLSRGLCREYNLFFEANDIVVSPGPLSTKQTDARLIAPRKLAHLIGVTTSDTLSSRRAETPLAPETRVSGESSEQAASPSRWTLLAQFLKFALLLIMALLPALGTSQIQSQSKLVHGPRAGSLWFSSGQGRDIVCCRSQGSPGGPCPEEQTAAASGFSWPAPAWRSSNPCGIEHGERQRVGRGSSSVGFRPESCELSRCGLQSPSVSRFRSILAFKRGEVEIAATRRPRSSQSEWRNST